MKKCSHPEHPYCTQWVLPGERACPSGHLQPAAALAADELPGEPPRPLLHISGFDPRAAGGRQTIKVELRGMPEDAPAAITMELASALFPGGASRHAFERNLQGHWRPQFVEFSSRDKEHGQYRVEAELRCSHGTHVRRRWVCTLIILVPRSDASLSEIHQTFLATHKNVSVTADDGSIARVSAQAGGGRLDIGVTARNASIARLDLDARNGRVAVGFSSIAWDEDLIEIEIPEEPEKHPHPATAGEVSNHDASASLPRHIRMFALDEFVLGRFDPHDSAAAIPLAHFAGGGHRDEGGLTRRLSARHAVIRRSGNGFEIEDVSRYGLLVDGAWPGKHQPAPLRLGTRIEMTASVRGVVQLVVTALLPTGLVLHREDDGAQDECFVLVDPERHPGREPVRPAMLPRAAAMPLLFHHNGGFWRLDPAGGTQVAVIPDPAFA
ncbi:FHA domain-containing protein [Massilia sp. RP-1-19]|uniref:FHA domain-containing protein n=1 Tax=Massilia polaris TaxID=2728846 RepID=A0A848HG80_9BURK|nr:FHA domain-containing protein [Massilia polaris]NML60886.1 FHA domain-containing protein [Massilia polaris]